MHKYRASRAPASRGNNGESIMITIKQEELIRSLISTMTDYEISNKLGVSRKLVASIRKMMNVQATGVSLKDTKRIQELLLLRVPISAIELKTKIHKDKISAIRRYYYLQHREVLDTCKCPTCGRTDIECIKQIMEKINAK